MSSQQKEEILSINLELCKIVREDCIEDKTEDKAGSSGRGSYYDVLKRVLI